MNVVLIGMPGSGKSTVGVLLAKALLYRFIDTDLIIQTECGKSLCDLISEKGLEGFIQTENMILSQLDYGDRCIIATGGSAVYGKDAMNSLKRCGKVVYLKVSPEELEQRIVNISTRGIAMPQGCTLSKLYNQRASFYEKYADVIIDCNGLNIEETVSKVMQNI
ncbi:MAG: shikimate kinase [Clostridia bacterium]|nr:shikimate kinase [Clostridia bacterium]